MPAFQGTSEGGAFGIISNGFGITATLDDGYFGKGIYFTTNMKYASKYARNGKIGKGKVYLLSLVMTANSFPIIEHPFQKDENGEF